MKLYKININNFRGISNFEIEGFKPINLFVGKNNCGKSSILEAIFISIGISNPNLILTIDGFRGLIHSETDDFRLIFRNLDYSNPVIIESEFIDKVQYRKLQIKPVFSNGTKIPDNKKEKVSTTVLTENNVINSLILDFEIKDVKTANPKHYQSSLLFRDGAFAIRPAKDYREDQFGVFIAHMGIPPELPNNINKILINKDENKLIKIINRIDPKILGITLGAKNLVLLDIGLPRRVPLNIMGDGVLKLLTIISYIAANPNTVVLIDEIENGFHFSSMEILWDSIIQSAISYNVQIFASTHSYECVEALNKQSVSLFSGSDDLVSLFRIEKKESILSYTKLDRKQIDTSINNNWEIR